MKIRTKVVLVIIATTLCLCAVLFGAFQSVLHRNYAKIENDVMQEALGRINFAIDREEITLNHLAATYSIWDETYKFVQDSNPDYINNYFNKQTFINGEINVFAIINNEGKIIKAEYFDILQRVELPLAQETLMAISDDNILCLNQEKNKFGLIQTIEGPLLFGSSPILTSQGEGPVRGTLVMGKFLNSQLIQKLSFLTKYSISFHTIENVTSGKTPKAIPLLSTERPVLIQPVNTKTLAGYYLIKDYYGNPYLIVSTETSRDVYEQGSSTIFWLLVAVIVIACAIIIVIIFAFDYLFLTRLRKLSKFTSNISKDGTFTERVSLKGKDELTDLSNELNAMLTRLSTINERLTESENKYSNLVEKSNDGIILINSDHIVYANPRILQMLGQTQEEFLGSFYLDFVNPRYRTKVSRIYNTRIRGGNAEDSYEIEINRKDQTSIPVEVNAKLIRINNQNCDMGIFRDISERKQAEKAIKESEQKYRSLVNNIKLGIFRSLPGENGKFIEINKAMEVITGYERDELLSLNVTDIYLNPIDRQIFHQEIISTPERATHELVFLKKDKTQITVSITASAVKDISGKVMYFDGIMEDISERKLLESRIVELYNKEKSQREQLEKEAQTKSLFIDILAHELKNPLTPIITSTEILQEVINSESNQMQKRLIANIRNGTVNLARKLEELLDMARYSRGSFILNKQKIVVRSYLEDVITRFKPSIEKQKQNLRVTIEGNMPDIEIDSSRIEQVLINLLSNASKFSPENSTIQLNARIKEKWLEIIVKDEGIGISEDDQKKLFEPYYRVQQEGRKVSGLGLGLTVCQKIIEAHGGKIWITSEIGKGSTFSFRIPLNI